MSEFVDAFDVVNGFLVLHVFVVCASASIICELAEKVWCFIGCAKCLDFSLEHDYLVGLYCLHFFLFTMNFLGLKFFDHVMTVSHCMTEPSLTQAVNAILQNQIVGEKNSQKSDE